MKVQEGITVCTRHQSEDNVKDEESEILANFEKLDFDNTLCTDSTDEINYNDGKEANQFDKIAKFYGRGKNVFLFNSLLRNEEFSKKIEAIIGEKCDDTQRSKFIERVTIYLNRIKQGEAIAKEFFKYQSFSGAYFFNGYHCGENKNILENLNINFTKDTQFLDMHDIFDCKIVDKEDGDLQRVKIYDNGQRAVTIKNNKGIREYWFTKDSACKLFIKNEKDTLYLDIIAGKVTYIEQVVNYVRTNPRKSELIEEIVNFSDILINQSCLKEAFKTYFNDEGKHKRSYAMQEQCLPIKTLEDLNNWEPCKHQHLTEHLHKRVKAEGPKTLVCHDMKGGYLEDRFINGTKDEDNYFFLHWPAVDIFVYFSHNFVTIPPCSWISAAHKNGVQILGTFITEWDDGAKICDEFLKEENSVNLLSQQLVHIAMHCNFDGWLINIENKLKPHQIPLMKKFVSFLTLRMSSSCPGSQIIWYDSIMKNGELKWQNALNDSNKMFFASCDGIFLNYNWKEEHLTESVRWAGPRQTDVYVGVDVFGRGCLGGGGFSTDVAVAEARKFGLSVAIFAPGWVHECLDVKEFKENQFKFWAALQKYCPARKLKELPCSSFCPGFGKKMFREGKVISSEPWYNLGLQSLQPIYSSSKNDSMELYSKDAYDGGGCIRLSSTKSSMAFEIWSMDFKFRGEFLISYTFKPISASTDVVLAFVKGGNITYFIGNEGRKFENCIRPSTEEEILQKGYKWRDLSQEQNSWITRTYLMDFKLTNMKSICARLYTSDTSPDLVSALLGEIKIIPLRPGNNLMYSDLLCDWDATNGKVKVQCVLEWKYQITISCSDIYVQIDGEDRKYIATTSQLNYKLEYIFPRIDYVWVILSPKCTRNENLDEERLRVRLPK